jgi:hypothetical protein
MRDREEPHQQLNPLQLNWFSLGKQRPFMAGLAPHMLLLVPSCHLGRPLVYAETLVSRPW